METVWLDAQNLIWDISVEVRCEGGRLIFSLAAYERDYF